MSAMHIKAVNILPGNIQIRESDSQTLHPRFDCAGSLIAIIIKRDDGTETYVSWFGSVAFVDYEG